jgi:hypothetical protein
MPSIPNWKEVYILRRGDKAIVWPPVLMAEQGDYVTFRALGVSAKIEFPLDEPFELDDSKHQPTAVKPAWKGVENPANRHEAVVRVDIDKSVTIKVKEESDALSYIRGEDDAFNGRGGSLAKGNTQVYAYSVYCLEINDFAEGNSSPVMMIEPPQPPRP